VIWHDHRISASKCKDTAPGASYVGQLIVDLTLDQLKTLDCGSLQPPNHPQQKLYPGAQIPTLSEVLDLVTCAGDRSIELNLETKLDPIVPAETWPVEKYVSDLVPLLQKKGYASRTYIQSFDWRTLIAIKRRFPQTRAVALLDDTTIVPLDRGVDGYPWLGGVDLAALKGDWVKAAQSIGASVLSPVHGTPSNLSVNSPEYEEFVNREVVKRAKKVGMEVVPWTVDDESTIKKLIEDGVQAIISNYPERVKFVARDLGVSAGKRGVKVPERCLKNAALKL
jgi:glycerophosphoryl diester phosphodiesterase